MLEQTFVSLNDPVPLSFSSFLSGLLGKAWPPSQLTASRVPDLAWRPVSGSGFTGTSSPSARLHSVFKPLNLSRERLLSLSLFCFSFSSCLFVSLLNRHF